jgi:hypothetical protein
MTTVFSEPFILADFVIGSKFHCQNQKPRGKPGTVRRFLKTN